MQWEYEADDWMRDFIIALATLGVKQMCNRGYWVQKYVLWNGAFTVAYLPCALVRLRALAVDSLSEYGS